MLASSARQVPRTPTRRLLSRAGSRGSRLCIAWRHAASWSRDSQRAAPSSLGPSRSQAVSRSLAAALRPGSQPMRLGAQPCSGGSQGSRGRHAAVRRRCGVGVGGVGDEFAERLAVRQWARSRARACGSAAQGRRRHKAACCCAKDNRFWPRSTSSFRALTDQTFLSPFTKESCVWTRLRILDSF